MPLLSSINKCSLYPYKMFPDADSNSFTVPYSDQFLLYSSLLDDADIDDYNNNNPNSPISFLHQNITCPLFFQSNEQQQELQSSPLVHNHEEQQQPMLTAFEEFTMADTSSNNGTSMGGYCTTENFHHKGLASDSATGIGTSTVGHMKIDEVHKNVNLSKKDRHSKINTAQGPRDRRMRLSLDIAKRFFRLQDMLGFDKASKTVDWLLSKSQSEIKKVANSKTHDGNNVATRSSDSLGAYECREEVSEVVNKDEYLSQSGEMGTNKVNNKSSSKKLKSKGKVSISLRNGFNKILAKETREKARARARERTKEKMIICTLQNHSNQDGNVHHFSNMDQNMLNQVLGPHSYSYVGQGHTMSDQDESQSNTSYWNPSYCPFNNLQQQINGTSPQLPFEDIQIYGNSIIDLSSVLDCSMVMFPLFE